ncbi:MAG: hypothetical protein A2Y17_05530 [Clostridiales bacterium GWF2_38_85]|nr:MAG: hypothetical protein A2Y17_05530 [Clostridiales bacterium GWF2_38_85]HBL83313.1 hypothetical protein [Clostridiales bacterium]
MRIPKRLKKENDKLEWRKVVGLFVLLTLITSIIYVIVMMIISPSADSANDDFVKLKSDYILTLSQCVLGIIVMLVPSVIEKRFSLHLPNYMYILYFIFLYCAIYLGEVRSFYYHFSQWDTVLHALSAAMLGAFGFIIIEAFNKTSLYGFVLSSIFVSLFAFCFALSIGAVWEIYEYTMDGILGLNMQKFALENGTNLIGRQALDNTMKDIITDAISAFIISAIGYISYKNKEKQIEDKRK